jgi:hypothetical protein
MKPRDDKSVLAAETEAKRGKFLSGYNSSPTDSPAPTNFYFTSGKRGSVSFHVERIQTWSESSVTARAREDPARKLR